MLTNCNVMVLEKSRNGFTIVMVCNIITIFPPKFINVNFAIQNEFL